MVFPTNQICSVCHEYYSESDYIPLTPVCPRCGAERILAILENKERLVLLTDEQLVEECLGTDAANYDVVIEMMNRIWPGWAEEDEDNVD